MTPSVHGGLVQVIHGNPIIEQQPSLDRNLNSLTWTDVAGGAVFKDEVTNVSTK